jgi:hypothetical protein
MSMSSFFSVSSIRSWRSTSTSARVPHTLALASFSHRGRDDKRGHHAPDAVPQTSAHTVVILVSVAEIEGPCGGLDVCGVEVAVECVLFGGFAAVADA